MKTEYKFADEVLQVTFPYASEIGAASITAQVVTVSVVSGTDASPAALLSGSAQVSGSEVRQLVTGGVAGVRYKLHCLATFNDNRKLAREYFFDVVAP